jgi:DNA-binding MarR family transcriptional regulator
VSHPVNDLDDTVHQRVRLGILAVLSELRRADFNYLRRTLGLTDGNLSRHLSVLEDAGHIAVEKTFDGRRPRTWIAATKRGKAAFTAEIDALSALIDRFRQDRP